MIIECINCHKKFKVDSKLIPENGRQIQCGSCNHIWHFKYEKPIVTTTKKNEQIVPIEEDKIQVSKKSSAVIKKLAVNDNDIKRDNKINENAFVKKGVNNNKISNFFSYLLVFIISFVALIILLDTLKSPLINVFPGLEIFLFNLFETLEDIKLFIIDLT
jgi:predicted Zn finger-like uncharacterized protein